MSGRFRALDDRGEAAVGLVIVVPVAFLFILAVVQFGMWSHATHIAQAAASHGLAAARTHNGAAADGVTGARQLLTSLGSTSLQDVTVNCERRTGSASVRITGTAVQVVPFLHLPVHAEATGPVERLVPGTGR